MNLLKIRSEKNQKIFILRYSKISNPSRLILMRGLQKRSKEQNELLDIGVYSPLAFCFRWYSSEPYGVGQCHQTFAVQQAESKFLVDVKPDSVHAPILIPFEGGPVCRVHNEVVHITPRQFWTVN